MEKIPKVKLCLEHYDGQRETFEVSKLAAQMIIRRLLEDGWPYMIPIIEGTRIHHQGHASNVFVGTNGKEIIL